MAGLTKKGGLSLDEYRRQRDELEAEGRVGDEETVRFFRGLQPGETFTGTFSVETPFDGTVKLDFSVEVTGSTRLALRGSMEEKIAGFWDKVSPGGWPWLGVVVAKCLKISACWAAVHQGHGVRGRGQDRGAEGEGVGGEGQDTAPGRARQAAHQRVAVLGLPVGPGGDADLRAAVPALPADLVQEEVDGCSRIGTGCRVSA